MMMRYEAPATVSAAVSLLAREKGVGLIMAGGTDLLVKMKSGLVEPDLIVDIKRIKPLHEVKKTASGISIGAALCNAALGENAMLKKLWPGVVEGANLIGSKQVQGRCTMAGNLCNASPAGDAVPALVAAGAKAVVHGPRGKRKLAVKDVPAGPGRTHLKKGEIITAIELPKREPRSADAYLRFIPRTEMDIAVVSAAVNLTLDAKGVVKRCAVALGAVAPTVVEVPAAARALLGTKLDDAALQKLAEAARAACRPIDDKRGTADFRTEVAGVLAQRAARIAYARAGGK